MWRGAAWRVGGRAWRVGGVARRGGWRGVLALLAEPERVEVRVELDVGQVRVAVARGVQVEQEACVVGGRAIGGARVQVEQEACVGAILPIVFAGP